MNTTVDRPDDLKVFPDHTQRDGRQLVYVYEEGSSGAASLVLWITPAVAAKWIAALTPLAAEDQQ